jgi:hypothetical protein
MKEFSTQQVLELACAAQRINNGYLKESDPVYAVDGQWVYNRQSNKMLMLCTLDPAFWKDNPADCPMPIKTTDEDVARAEEIRKYYRKLVFAAIEGENDFLTTINSILSNDTVKSNMFGYVACLPSVQLKDAMHTKVKKVARAVDQEYLAEAGAKVFDLDCEIIESIKSKNFDGFNICAIINNKMVSWINKTDLVIGPCVVVKAKVKDHTTHWKHGNAVTRLNYVKAEQ